MRMYLLGSAMPAPRNSTNFVNSSLLDPDNFLPPGVKSNERWIGIYRCTLTEELVRENMQFCRDFIEKQMVDRSQPLKIPILAISCLLLLLGLLGNILVILSVTVFPGMRSRTNLFLLNLALSDMLIFLICLPLTIYHVVQLEWVFGPVLCKLTPFLQGLSISVSVWSLASLSVKRFVVVRYPLAAKEALTNTRMGFWLAGIWLLSVLVCSPIPMVYEVREERVFWLVSVHSCVEHWHRHPSRKTVYTVCLFGLLYLLPLLAMSIFSWKLSRRLVSTARFSRGQVGQQSVSQGRVKASKVVMALLAAFSVCWLPYHVVNILIDLRHYGQQPPNLTANASSGSTTPSSALPSAPSATSTTENYLVTTLLPVALLLGYANSAINPVCLVLISSKFKACFLNLVTLRCVRQRHAVVVTRSGSGGEGRAALQMTRWSKARRLEATEEGRQLNDEATVHLAEQP